MFRANSITARSASNDKAAPAQALVFLVAIVAAAGCAKDAPEEAAFAGDTGEVHGAEADVSGFEAGELEQDAASANGDTAEIAGGDAGRSEELDSTGDSAAASGFMVEGGLHRANHSGNGQYSVTGTWSTSRTTTCALEGPCVSGGLSP